MSGYARGGGGGGFCGCSRFDLIGALPGQIKKNLLKNFDFNPDKQLYYQDLRLGIPKRYVDDVSMFEPVVASQLCENFDKLSKEEKNRACFIRGFLFPVFLLNWKKRQNRKTLGTRLVVCIPKGEAAWPSGKGAGLEIQRSRVQVPPRPRL